MLLQYGADPRLYAEDGMTPGQQSSFEHVRKLLETWDISLTDRMLQKLAADEEKQRADDRQMTEAQVEWYSKTYISHFISHFYTQKQLLL